MTSTRHLDWPACYNVRDLGGLPTADGRETRWRAVVRSDIPSRLTHEGRQALISYGVRTLVDLREPDQTREKPSIFMTRTGSVDEPTYLNRPLESRLPRASALINKARDRADVYGIILDHYPALIARAVRTIANAKGGVLIHCEGGKDRTGIISALLLGLAGVPDEVICVDYGESQERLWPLWEQIVEQAGGEESVDFWLKPTATADMMQRTLDHLKERYSGVRDYLLHAGSTPEELGRMRARMLRE